MARTQKNKATNYHLGTLKAKLARLRNELFVEQSGGSGGSSGGSGFEVARNGDARIALIGKLFSALHLEINSNSK